MFVQASTYKKATNMLINIAEYFLYNNKCVHFQSIYGMQWMFSCIVKLKQQKMIKRFFLLFKNDLSV